MLEVIKRVEIAFLCSFLLSPTTAITINSLFVASHCGLWGKI